MKAFCEKSDLVLRTLTTSSPLSLEQFTEVTKVRKPDAVLVFLKEKEFIQYCDHEIRITDKGREFISNSSFVQQKDNTTQHLYQ